MNIKTFGKSAAIYSLGTIAARISVFVLIPIYTHYLSMDEFGLLSILLLAIQLLSTFIDFGLLKSIMRFEPEYRENKKDGELLGSALVLNITSGIIVILIAVIVLPLLLQNLNGIDNPYLILVLTTMAAFSQSINLNFISYFRAQNNVKWFTLLSVLTALLTVFFGFFLIVYLKQNLKGALIAYILSYSIVFTITIIKLVARTRFSFSKKTFKALAKYGFPLMFARSGDLMVSLVAVYLLGVFVSLSEVAIYNLAFKIATVMNLVLVLPFQLALEPFVFNSIGDDKLRNNLSKIGTYLVFVFFIISFLLIFISPLLLKFIAPPEYAKAFYIMIYLLPIFLFQSFSYFGEALLHINKKSNITGLVAVVMTLMSLILNYFLIPLIGIMGIILTINFNYFLSALILFHFGKKEYFVKLELNRFFIISILFIIIIYLLVWLQQISTIMYYIVPPIILLVLFIILFRFKFFDTQERETIMLFLNRYFSLNR